MRFSAQSKKDAVFAVVKDGCKLSEVAKKHSISRKTLYQWIARYTNSSPKNRKSSLEARYPSGKDHPKAIYPKVKVVLQRLMFKHPEWGTRKLSAALKDKGIVLSSYSIHKYLEKCGVNTESLRNNYKRNYAGPGRFATDVKLEIVRKITDGKNTIASVAKNYKVSRKAVYGWIERYKKAQSAGDFEGSALKEKYVTGSMHPKAIYPKVTGAVLDTITRHPEYSVHKLAETAKLSSWTVWKILDRNSLNMRAQREAFSRANIQPQPAYTGFFNRVKSVLEGFIPNLAPAPPPQTKLNPASFLSILKTFTVAFALSFVTSSASIYWLKLFRNTSFANGLGLVFATVALLMGSFFFLYSLKYYLTLALVLSYSQIERGLGKKEARKRGLLSWIIGSGSGETGNGNSPIGLEANLEHVKLDNYPYISVQIPFYNEKYVVERAMQSATNFEYKGEYEVMLCDDSIDETSDIIREYQKKHLAKGEKLHTITNKEEGWTLTSVEVRPGVILKHLHREKRSGFKGAALALALTLTDPRTEFISVFDADFVPYPDSLYLFLKYFKAQNNMSEDYTKSNVAAVQGYQWHVLNKSENWITRGVRSEYAGSYVIERSGTEIYQGLKQISGSVYMIRRDVLEEVGWETSITEDFELTLKLYNAGYKVAYTPYVQAPAECVST